MIPLLQPSCIYTDADAERDHPAELFDKLGPYPDPPTWRYLPKPGVTVDQLTKFFTSKMVNIHHKEQQDDSTSSA